LRPLVEARVFDCTAICQGGKGQQADIKPSPGIGLWQRSGIVLDAEADIPLATLTLEREHLDRTIDRAMQFDLDVSNALDVETRSRQAAAIAIAGEGVAVKASSRLKARISGFKTSHDAAKESFEGLVNAPQDILCRRKVRQTEMSSAADLFELVSLTVVVQRDTRALVGIATFLQCGIVQATGFAKLGIQCLVLCSSREEAVLVGLTHLRPSLLVFDVAAHRGFRDVANRADIVAATPQRRQLRAQMPEFLPQDTRGVAFELCRKLRRSHAGIALNTQVDVIRHHVQCVQRGFQLLSFRGQQRLQAFGDRPLQYRLAVLGAENEVILERKDRASVACIPALFHARSIALCLMNSNHLTGQSRRKRLLPLQGNPAFPCQLKQVAPCEESYGKTSACQTSVHPDTASEIALSFPRRLRYTRRAA